MDPVKLLLLFSVLFLAILAKSITIPWSPDNFKVSCPIIPNVLMCNAHLPTPYHCFCHAKRPNSTKKIDFNWYEEYNTCDELSKTGLYPKDRVVEVHIDLKNYQSEGVSWLAFDFEFAILMSETAGVAELNQIFIIRKFCNGPDSLVVQFVILAREDLIKHYEDKLEVTGMLPDMVPSFFENGVMKYIPRVKQIRPAKSVIKQDSLKYFSKDFCKNGAQLSLPIVCNNYNPKIACICGHNRSVYDAAVPYGWPFCDYYDKRFYDNYGHIYTLVFGSVLNKPMSEIEHIVIKDLAHIQGLSEKDYIILRKYCQDSRLYIQVARLNDSENAPQPPFNFNDFTDTALHSAPLKEVVPFIHAGELDIDATDAKTLLRSNDFARSDFDNSYAITKWFMETHSFGDWAFTATLCMIGILFATLWTHADQKEEEVLRFFASLERKTSDDSDQQKLEGVEDNANGIEEHEKSDGNTET